MCLRESLSVICSEAVLHQGWNVSSRCLSVSDPHNFNLSVCFSFSLCLYHQCHICLFSFPPSPFLQPPFSPVYGIFIYSISSLLILISPSTSISLISLFYYFFSLISSSYFFHPSLTLYPSPLSTDHNRPEASVYRQSHRDISFSSHGCCHYCSGPGGKVRST